MKSKILTHSLGGPLLTCARRFRWVYLVEQRFLGCNSREILRIALRDLPLEVVDIYAQVLKDIPEDDRKSARLILIWLTYSIQPLTLEELASAVSIPSPQKVLDICTSSLVSLQPTPPQFISTPYVVNFDHFSVKEYLTSERFRTSPETNFFYVSPLIAHLTMAEISVSRFININNFNLATGLHTGAELTEDFDVESWPPGRDPILSYSTLWYKHIHHADAIDRSKAQSAEPQQISNVLRDQIHRLFCKEYSQSFENWYHLLRETCHDVDRISRLLHRKATSPIIVACWVDLFNNVQRLLDAGADIDGDVRNVNSNHQSTLHIKITRPIHAAAISGNLEILKLLLEKGATLNQLELDMVAHKNIRQGADVLTEILRDRPNLKITDNTVTASAMSWKSKEMLSYILDHENRLTQYQLVAIAKKYITVGQDFDVIEKMISYGERNKYDRNEMLIAFLRRSSCGFRIEMVLHRYQPPNSMTKSVLQSVLANPGAHLMLEFVLRYYMDVGVDIHISPKMLEQAQKGRSNFMIFGIILNHAKTVAVGTKTLKGLKQRSEGNKLLNLVMNHEICGFGNHPRKRTKRFEFLFGEHLRTCPLKITNETLQAATQLDETALESLRKNAMPNVIFPSADEIRGLVEKRRNGTQQQTESTLARMPSSEPAPVPQSKVC